MNKLVELWISLRALSDILLWILGAGLALVVLDGIIISLIGMRWDKGFKNKEEEDTNE